MDQLRNFTQSNRSSIVNILYLVAAFVLVYYIVMYYVGGDTKDVNLLEAKTATNVAAGKILTIAESADKFRLGAEYTLSFWIYINSYSNATTVQNILSVFDMGKTGTAREAMLFVGLHPTKPQMIIRAGNGAVDATAANNDPMLQYTYTEASGQTPAQWTWGGESATVDASALKPCDIMDIDLQRWLNIVVSMNGRIMDVYLDGKLARSCILSESQVFAPKGKQVLQMFNSSNYFTGYISGIAASNYAVTPDVIYGRYQAGPYLSPGFLSYLTDKLGITIAYTGTSGVEQTTTV